MCPTIPRFAPSPPVGGAPCSFWPPRPSFPPRWHHDVLRALDHFQASGAPYDERLDDPIALVLKRRTAAGRWLLQNRHPGAAFFELETVGQPSRWNTLRALRVLRWHDRVKGNSTAPRPRPDPQVNGRA